MFFAAAGVSAAVATPALAATGGVYYRVDMNVACHEMYNDYQSVGLTNMLWSPYSWACYHLQVGWPFAFYVEGGVDVQNYCSITYPGSVATVAGAWYSRWPSDRWACVGDH